MARPDKNTAYSILAPILIAVFLPSTAALSVIAGQDGEFELRGLALLFAVLATVSFLVLVWIALGFFTPLYDLPDLPSDQSYLRRLRAYPGRPRVLRKHRERQRDARVRHLPRELEWNRLVLELALTEKKVWSDRGRGLNLRDDRYPELLGGATGTVWDFLSRCQDADRRLRRVAVLALEPGYGEPLSTQDERLIEQALQAVAAALDARHAALQEMSG